MEQQNTIDDILEIVQFLKENGATKEDLLRFATKEDLLRFATKEDLEAMKREFLSHVDGFIKLHQQLDTEITALKSAYHRLDAKIEQLAGHGGMRFP